MQTIKVQHAEIRSVALKDVKELGTIAEVKMHFRLGMQKSETLNQLTNQIGEGPALLINIERQQLEFGETDPGLAQKKKPVRRKTALKN